MYDGVMKRFFGILALVSFFALSAHAQTVQYPARGVFNGFLNQTNILECENTGPDAAMLGLQLNASDGSTLTSTIISLAGFATRHIILNDLTNINDRIGTYLLTRVSGPSNLGTVINCRTAFYRFGSPTKQFQFGYVLPVRNPLSGTNGGVYNSYDPSGLGIPTLNWLSIINTDDTDFSAALQVYQQDGSLSGVIETGTLQPGERRDFPLGHTDGERSGVYIILPSDSSVTYEAFVMRYNAVSTSQFTFAFPLRAASGASAQQLLQTSTMGNGLTANWLEIANLRGFDTTVHVTLRNAAGTSVHEEDRLIPAHGQSHLYVNPYLDPNQVGAVGTAAITPSGTGPAILAQSSYYGRIPNSSSIEWAYAVQSSPEEIDETEQAVFPVNTYLGMFNWLKGANGGGSPADFGVSVLNDRGTNIGGQTHLIPAAGTSDYGLHEIAGSNLLGSVFAAPLSANAHFRADLLRVLPRTGGQIGSIMQIPPVIKPAVDLPDPQTGYFPADSVWYQDISNAPLDSQSSAVISALNSAGGWGLGRMQIDFSIEVLRDNGAAPFRTFTATDDFYSPDCDYAQMPVPVGGAIEGENGYSCESDGDCHLIVVHQPTRKLYEMWRANITGGNFFGGCLVVWDMNRTYGPTGRGVDCTSADAAGYPIAPLLFSADEVAAGEINHAIRFILPNARIRHNVYVAPATHSTGAASGGTNAVPYGARLRLRADFPLQTLPNEAARVVARAMQRYGILLADGGNVALTAQSDRFTTAKWDGLLEPRDLEALKVTDFQMVDGGQRRTWTGDCVRNQ